MLNRCEFIGNLGRDPEARTTTAGKRVVSFSLAVTEKWKDQSGERRERTEWVPVVIWNEGIGRVAEQYLRKGSRCYVAGQMQTRKWQDQSGNDRYTTEIVLNQFDGKLLLLDSRSDGQGERAAPADDRRGAASPDLGEDIPFAPER